MKNLKKIFPFLVIVILLIIIRNNIISIFDSLGKTGATNTFEEKLAREEKKNRFLKERLNYVKSDEFVEEEARIKLGLLQEGEYFVIAPTPSLEDKKIVIDDRPNWKKWWELFF